MGMFDHFPYTNFHELNLDWILQALKELEHTINQFVAINSLKYADPIQWNIVKQYEKNTIVIDPLTGTAYISVDPVPSGVALTNTDYWTVVFDLGSFVVRAAKNFTNRYEAETTLTATFPTTKGNWLVWGDTLYKALVNITAGDTYVIDSNIEHFTIEDIYHALLDIIGDLDDLDSTDKSSIVNSINSVIDAFNNTIGDLDDLDSTDKSSIVNAINSVIDSVNTTIGDLDDLDTTDKSSVVNAINEVNTTIGDLNDLYTTDKSSVVNAINDVMDVITKSAMPTFTMLYVDSVNGDDNNTGLSPAEPIKTLNHGMQLFGLYSNSITFVFMSSHTETISYGHFQMINIQLEAIEYDVPVNLTFTNNITLHTGYFNAVGSNNNPFIINGSFTGDNNAIYLEQSIVNGNITNRFSGFTRCDNTTINGYIDIYNGNLTNCIVNGNVRCVNGICAIEQGLTASGTISTYSNGQFVTNGAITIKCSDLSLRTGWLFARADLTIDCTNSALTTYVISVWGGGIVCYGNLTLTNSAEATLNSAMQLRGCVFVALNVIDNTGSAITVYRNKSLISNLNFNPQSRLNYVTNSYVNETQFIPNSIYIMKGDITAYKMRFKLDVALPDDTTSITIATITDRPPYDIMISMMSTAHGGIICMHIDSTSGDVKIHALDASGATEGWYNGNATAIAFNTKAGY